MILIFALNVEKTVNEQLKKLNFWLNINRLSLNISKTNFVTFHPYNITLKINKNAIVEKEYIKYLGVIIDSHLNWKQHILNISKKISRCIGILYELKPVLNNKKD